MEAPVLESVGGAGTVCWNWRVEPIPNSGRKCRLWKGLWMQDRETLT